MRYGRLIERIKMRDSPKHIELTEWGYWERGEIGVMVSPKSKYYKLNKHRHLASFRSQGNHGYVVDFYPDPVDDSPVTFSLETLRELFRELQELNGVQIEEPSLQH